MAQPRRRRSLCAWLPSPHPQAEGLGGRRRGGWRRRRDESRSRVYYAAGADGRHAHGSHARAHADMMSAIFLLRAKGRLICDGQHTSRPRFSPTARPRPPAPPGPPAPPRARPAAPARPGARGGLSPLRTCALALRLPPCALTAHRGGPRRENAANTRAFSASPRSRPPVAVPPSVPRGGRGRSRPDAPATLGEHATKLEHALPSYQREQTRQVGCGAEPLSTPPPPCA